MSYSKIFRNNALAPREIFFADRKEYLVKGQYIRLAKPEDIQLILNQTNFFEEIHPDHPDYEAACDLLAEANNDDTGRSIADLKKANKELEEVKELLAEQDKNVAELKKQKQLLENTLDGVLNAVYKDDVPRDLNRSDGLHAAVRRYLGEQESKLNSKISELNTSLTVKNNDCQKLEAQAKSLQKELDKYQPATPDVG